MMTPTTELSRADEAVKEPDLDMGEKLLDAYTKALEHQFEARLHPGMIRMSEAAVAADMAEDDLRGWIKRNAATARRVAEMEGEIEKLCDRLCLLIPYASEAGIDALLRADSTTPEEAVASHDRAVAAAVKRLAEIEAEDDMRCGGCDAVIPDDAPTCRTTDGDQLCVECAPTWAEMAQHMIDTGGDDPDVPERGDHGRIILAEIAAGTRDGNAKAVYPQALAPSEQHKEVG